MTPARYRGRFAPTPSGALHFGSMVAAVGSYLDAKAHAGEWSVRIDDLDPPRVVAGSADSIVRALEAFGMEWDGPVAYQRSRGEAYGHALERLRADDRLYACTCTRREIADAGIAGIEGPVYPGTCRNGPPAERDAIAWRVRTTGIRIEFDDLLQGRVHQDLERDIGDFVVCRADGVYGYHLACAIDDGEQGITHVVRGADLLASTPRQIYLQRLLGLVTPAYLHLPVALNASGEKLSKQTLAQPVNAQSAPATLSAVFAFLGHTPPREVLGSDLAAQWQWARAEWRRSRLPRTVPPLQIDSGAPS